MGDSGKLTILKVIDTYYPIAPPHAHHGMSRVRQVIDEPSIQTPDDTVVRPAYDCRAEGAPLRQGDILTICAEQALFDQAVRPSKLGGQDAYPPGYQRVLQVLWEGSAVQKV